MINTTNVKMGPVTIEREGNILGSEPAISRPTSNGKKTMLLLLDRSGTGWVHSFPLDLENERILHTQCETSLWGHTYGVRDFGVAVLNNQLYVLGGYDTRERSSSGRILRFDPRKAPSKQWESLCPMNMARTKLAASSLDGHIYVTGGVKTDGKSTGSCEMYDPERNAWRKAGMLPSPRKDHAIISYDHSIYLSGGFQGKCGHRNLWAYEDHQWRETDVDCPQELVSPRERHSMVKIDNTIYFIGGITHETVEKDGELVYHAQFEERVEAFKPRVVASILDNKLDLISPWTWDSFRLNIGRFNPATVAIGNKIYIIGGTNPERGGSISEVECYDSTTNKCSMCFTLSKANNYHNVVCVVLEYPLVPPVDVIENEREDSSVQHTPDFDDREGKWVLW